MQSKSVSTTVALAVALVAACTTPSRALDLFSDEFDAFTLDTIWQTHGAGAPSVALGLSQPGILQMHSASGAGEYRGVETTFPISLDGLTNVTFDVRLRPINQGEDGTPSSAEMAILGSSGEFVRAFASNNVGPVPATSSDWADFYEDSRGNTGGSGAYAHCGSGGCDSFRRFVVDIDQFGTTLEVRNADESLHAFSTYYPDLTISDLGTSVAVALRHQAVGSGDDIIGQFDSIRVTTDTESGTTPASGPLVGLPYSSFTSSPWKVRHLAGQSSFTIASYGNPTGLSTLQQYVAMLETRGIGNGINHGSAPRPHVEQDYQYIKSIGWPMTVHPGTADFQVGGGTSLDPTYLLSLQILDTPEVRAPVHFGEWGYYFHELSSNAGYFASIYPGQDPSEYAHLMKAPGSKGFDSPPVDKVDAYNQVKAYYLGRNADWDGRLESVTGHSHYEAYAAEWGTPTIGLEIGENIRFTQSKFAFARGASRQWDIPWSSQISPWFHGSLTTAGELTGGPGTARGQDAGHSFSFYRRAWLHSWFAGAASVEPEASQQNLFENGAPSWDLTPLGELAQETFNFMQSQDRGVPYTPVAIVLDRYSGYNGFQDKPWGVFSKTTGDQQTYDLFQHQLFPGSAASNNPNATNPEAPYLVATPYGEMFDVLLSTATSSALTAYPEILLVGDISFEAGFVDELEAALESGSRLLINQTHASELGADLTRLQDAGTVEILNAWMNPSTGRSSAISNARLDELVEEHMPIDVSGDDVQYQINRNADGWVVELINNSGVTKLPHLPAVIDPNAVANVLLFPHVDILGVYDWESGALFDVNSAPIELAIGPGEVSYIQFVIGLPGDFNRDGAVDAADYSLWRDQLGQTVLPGTGPDGNGDGIVDTDDYGVWRTNFGRMEESALLAGLSIVPEPSTNTIALILGLCLFRRFWRHRFTQSVARCPLRQLANNSLGCGKH